MRIYSLYAMESIETQRRFFRQSVMRKKKKLRKSLASLVEKNPDFFDEWKAYLEINFFSFSLISD